MESWSWLFFAIRLDVVGFLAVLGEELKYGVPTSIDVVWFPWVLPPRCLMPPRICQRQLTVDHYFIRIRPVFQFNTTMYSIAYTQSIIYYLLSTIYIL